MAVPKKRPAKPYSKIRHSAWKKRQQKKLLNGIERRKREARGAEVIAARIEGKGKKVAVTKIEA